jgi:hypothetical protein
VIGGNDAGLVYWGFECLVVMTCLLIKAMGQSLQWSWPSCHAEHGAAGEQQQTAASRPKPSYFEEIDLVSRSTSAASSIKRSNFRIVGGTPAS